MRLIIGQYNAGVEFCRKAHLNHRGRNVMIACSAQEAIRMLRRIDSSNLIITHVYREWPASQWDEEMAALIMRHRHRGAAVDWWLPKRGRGTG